VSEVLLVLATRQATESPEEFLLWWYRHAEVAAEIPGLRRYRVFGVAEEPESATSELAWDGFSVLEFDDGVDARASLFESPEGRRALADVGDRGGRRRVLVSRSAHEVVLPFVEGVEVAVSHPGYESRDTQVGEDV
jgi:hypothetical protein